MSPLDLAALIGLALAFCITAGFALVPEESRAVKAIVATAAIAFGLAMAQLWPLVRPSCQSIQPLYQPAQEDHRREPF